MSTTIAHVHVSFIYNVQGRPKISHHIQGWSFRAEVTCAFEIKCKAPQLLKTLYKFSSFYWLKWRGPMNKGYFFDKRDSDQILGHSGHQKWNCDHWLGKSSKLGDLSPFHILTISQRMSDLCVANKNENSNEKGYFKLRDLHANMTEPAMKTILKRDTTTACYICMRQPWWRATAVDWKGRSPPSPQHASHLTLTVWLSLSPSGRLSGSPP